MPERHPHDLDQELRRLLGEPEPGDDALVADPSMRRLVEALDGVDPDDELDQPPPGLWDAIAAGAGVSSDPPAERPRLVATDSEPAPADSSVAPLRPGSSPPWWLGAAAAVLVVVVIAVGAFAIMSDDDPAPAQLASAELEVLLEADATGAATLISDQEIVVLELDVDGLDAIDGYYEVWLLTPEVDALISLGPLRSDGRYELPEGLDHTRYSVVDVSIEPHDGDPNHSGNSILRGGLEEA
jgi:hypothetical protein